MRGREAILIALVAAGFALLFVRLADAHSRPIRFDPAPGAVLSAAPAQVTGWFTSDIRRDPNWSFLHVTGPAGQRVDTGETTLSVDRLQMTANLSSDLGPGQYIVTWRTFDDGDGEIFGDCYTFFVGQEAANAALAAKTRLDAGSQCERIEVSTENATPVPGQTVVAGDHQQGGPGALETGNGDGEGGIPTWLFIVGIGGGLAVGLVGGRLIGSRG